MTHYGIYKLFDFGQWKAVLRTCLVQINKVYAYLPLPISLLDQHNIGKPCLVINALYKPNFQKLIDLYLDSLIVFRVKNSPLLLDRVMHGVNI